MSNTIVFGAYATIGEETKNSIVMGNNALSEFDNTIVLGNNLKATKENQISIGDHKDAIRIDIPPSFDLKLEDLIKSLRSVLSAGIDYELYGTIPDVRHAED